jgi:hypothetical protein
MRRPLPRAALLEALHYVLAALAPSGVPVAVAYGTLLGLHRDGALIDGDDDVDFFVADEHWPCLLRALAAVCHTPRAPVRSSQPPSAPLYLSYCAEALGFAQLFYTPPHDPSVHVPVEFYVFEAHDDSGSVLVPWDGLLLPRAMLLPYGERVVAGAAVPFLAEPDDFCAAIYGPTWRVPDAASKGACLYAPWPSGATLFQHVVTVAEFDTFPAWARRDAPSPRPPPRVLSAAYGFPSTAEAASMADVTARVRDVVARRRRVRALNVRMGGDPLPGRTKWLFLQLDGGCNVAVPEGASWCADPRPCGACGGGATTMEDTRALPRAG